MWLVRKREVARGRMREGNNTKLLFCRHEIAHTLRDHVCTSSPSLFSLLLLVVLKEDEDRKYDSRKHLKPGKYSDDPTQAFFGA